MESTKRAALLYVQGDAEMTKEDAEPLSLLIESFYASGNLDPIFLDNIVKKLTLACEYLPIAEISKLYPTVSKTI